MSKQRHGVLLQVKLCRTSVTPPQRFFDIVNRANFDEPNHIIYAISLVSHYDRIK